MNDLMVLMDVVYSVAYISLFGLAINIFVEYYK